MKMLTTPDAADLDAVRRWFIGLADCVRAVDYKAAFPLFAEDLIAFGTHNDFVTGRTEVMQAQWMKVWPTIRNFRWRQDGVVAIVAPDRLSAAGLAVFDSDGFDRDGSRFDRRGRATVSLARTEVGADWIAVHTHMSLFVARLTSPLGSSGQNSAPISAGHCGAVPASLRYPLQFLAIDGESDCSLSKRKNPTGQIFCKVGDEGCA